MLRFNNQAIPKPVDFYRPLSVDVSVEYELPKEVAPPPGSAPLLIIHPSAYVRNKGPRKSQDSAFNSTLLYLRAALPQANKPSSSSRLANNPQVQQNDTLHQQRYSGPNPTTSVHQSLLNMSRTARTHQSSCVCPYGKCDECYGSQSGSSSGLSGRSGKKPGSGGGGGGSGGGRQPSNPASFHRRDLNELLRLGLPNLVTNFGCSNSSGIDRTSDGQGGTYSGGNSRSSSSTTKRLRMSNGAEPLNLAFGSSASQLAALALNKEMSPYMNYSAADNSTFDFAQLRIPSLKVEKGSGSDSGVCSENDSDVSPPMIGTLGRRSVISQELTPAGCYCCCCPPNSVRKGSGSTGGKKYVGGFGGREDHFESNYRKWILGIQDTGQHSGLGRWFQV